jgi:hypothetical protein
MLSSGATSPSSLTFYIDIYQRNHGAGTHKSYNSLSMGSKEEIIDGSERMIILRRGLIRGDAGGLLEEYPRNNEGIPLSSAVPLEVIVFVEEVGSTGNCGTNAPKGKF